MTVKRAVVVLEALLGAILVAPAAAQVWEPARCDISPKHYLVNSGVLYLKAATEGKYADARAKDLKDARKVLLEAVTTGGQEKNAAAWYYLARYYALQNDLAGADSAFTKAVALLPSCKEDVDHWRRTFWVPVFNEGVKAWQAGNTDSAIASFRRANAIYAGEPTGFIYLATLFSGAHEPDSSAKYFKLAVPAAGTDPKFAKQKRDALFNVARVYHAAQHWDGAAAGYHDYLAVYPSDVQAIAGLAAVYTQQGNRDSAGALYGRILDHADSAEATDLFGAAQAILNAIPTEPDTAPVGAKCRTATRARNKTLTVRQVATRCATVTDDSIKAFQIAVAYPRYRLAARAYETGLLKNPSAREALYNLGGIYYIVGDTAKALPVAQRLYGVDPLNRSSIAKLAGAWQLQGKKDSVLHYLTVADSLTFEVTVSSFTPDEKSAKLDGLFTNLKTKPTSPAAVLFQFLNAQGQVADSSKQDVPALEASSNRPFSITTTHPGIVAWRYRKSS
jgi:tetratricopeptide (TPR) repeat protein